VRPLFPALPRPAALALLTLSCATSCATQTGDPHNNDGIPPVGGKNLRIKDVSDPTNPRHADYLQSSQSVSGALVSMVDTYDETHDGKSNGTIYVQDLGSKDPYSGTTLYSPSFNPGNLRVSPGDVLDLRGQFTEASKLGTTVTFAAGAVLPQISQPVATFRYETQVPQPVDIDANDLTDFTKGRRWIGMLVRVQGIALQSDATAGNSGRVSVDLSAKVPGADTKCTGAFPKPASLVNALFPLEDMNLKQGTRPKAIVGLVGFFCNLQLAPRSAADIQL
jgi:hypothetical protein